MNQDYLRMCVERSPPKHNPTAFESSINNITEDDEETYDAGSFTLRPDSEPKSTERLPQTIRVKIGSSQQSLRSSQFGATQRRLTFNGKRIGHKGMISEDRSTPGRIDMCSKSSKIQTERAAAEEIYICRQAIHIAGGFEEGGTTIHQTVRSAQQDVEIHSCPQSSNTRPMTQDNKNERHSKQRPQFTSSVRAHSQPGRTASAARSMDLIQKLREASTRGRNYREQYSRKRSSESSMSSVEADGQRKSLASLTSLIKLDELQNLGQGEGVLWGECKDGRKIPFWVSQIPNDIVAVLPSTTGNLSPYANTPDREDSRNRSETRNGVVSQSKPKHSHQDHHRSRQTQSSALPPTASSSRERKTRRRRVITGPPTGATCVKGNWETTRKTMNSTTGQLLRHAGEENNSVGSGSATRNSTAATRQVSKSEQRRIERKPQDVVLSLGKDLRLPEPMPLFVRRKSGTFIRIHSDGVLKPHSVQYYTKNAEGSYVPLRFSFVSPKNVTTTSHSSMGVSSTACESDADLRESKYKNGEDGDACETQTKVVSGASLTPPCPVSMRTLGINNIPHPTAIYVPYSGPPNLGRATLPQLPSETEQSEMQKIESRVAMSSDTSREIRPHANSFTQPLTVHSQQQEITPILTDTNLITNAYEDFMTRQSDTLVPEMYEMEGEKVTYVEVPQIHEVIKEVPVIQKEFVVVEKKVPQVQYIDKIVEVPQIQYVDTEEEVEEIHEKIVYVPKREIVEIPKEVVKYVPKIETKIVEKIVEIPKTVNVPVIQTTTEEILIPRFRDIEVPVVVSQTMQPVLVIDDSPLDREVMCDDANPEIVYVDVYVPKPVDVKATQHSANEEHYEVGIPPAQYNTLLRQLNQHLASDQQYVIPYKHNADGTVHLLPHPVPGVQLHNAISADSDVDSQTDDPFDHIERSVSQLGSDFGSLGTIQKCKRRTITTSDRSLFYLGPRKPNCRSLCLACQ